MDVGHIREQQPNASADVSDGIAAGLRQAPRHRLGLTWLLAGTPFERGAVALSCVFAGGAYLDAWSDLNRGAGPSVLAPWQDIAAHTGWLLLTVWLGLGMIVGLSRGARWQNTLPTAYLIALGSCGIYGLALIVDQYVQLAAPRPIGLSRLLSPLPVVQILAGAVIVGSPLRAAWDRGDRVARPETVLSATLVLSAITFFLQFAHPFRDPWAGGTRPPSNAVAWVLEDFGVTALLVQAAVLVGLLLLLARRFELRLGSVTTVCVLNALLVATLKSRWEMVAVGLVTGASGDLLYAALRPSVARPVAARAFAALLAAAFTASFFATVAVTQGVWWDANLWTGVIVSAATSGWLLSYLMFVPPVRVSTSAHAQTWPAHVPDITATAVKDAMETIHDAAGLSRTRLIELRFLSGSPDNRSAELRELLIDILRELEASRLPRDAEAGRLLVDYYVRRVGTHEVVAQRLHLSRPTFYRRLQRGLELVAERLDEMGEAAIAIGGWTGGA